MGGSKPSYTILLWDILADASPAVLQVVQVQWWVPGKGDPSLASTTMPPVQAMGRQ